MIALRTGVIFSGVTFWLTRLVTVPIAVTRAAGPESGAAASRSAVSPNLLFSSSKGEFTAVAEDALTEDAAAEDAVIEDAPDAVTPDAAADAAFCASCAEAIAGQTSNAKPTEVQGSQRCRRRREEMALSMDLDIDLNMDHLRRLRGLLFQRGLDLPIPFPDGEDRRIDDQLH